MATWEARRALRYGSESVGHYTTKESALRRARREIKANGSVGRVGYIDKKKRVVYYDIYEEEC